jgi:2',3'-cyclic-nucleotide 2'-phosphodiesterase (5'-nucleotidase family)
MRLAPRTAFRFLAGALATLIFLTAWLAFFRQEVDPPEVAAAPPTKAEPQVLFEKWPQDRKPDLVIVLTGQMYGFLQKCGCSTPQKGGLERRYNFIESLKARGWEVISLDVGDVPRPLPYTPTSQQTLTKYEMAMQAMKLMGYRAVTVGKEELAMPLLDALTKYTVQKGNDYPKVHAANIGNREDFPGSDGGSALTESDIITTKSGIAIGVVGVAGAELIQKGVDRSVRYTPDTGKVVKGILDGWKKAEKSPDVRVLLYQGPFEWTDPGTGQRADAQTAAKGFPQFHIIVCKTPDESDGPNMPTVVNGTDPDTNQPAASMICQVGQKGQNVGVVGIFKGPKGTELYYQRVMMTDEFETPPNKEKGHPVLKLLQDYADTVKDNDYLSAMQTRKKQHVVQVRHKDAAFAGDQQCQACHQAEWALWSKSKHAHAYEALEKIARNPVGRNFDGECIICHTVGYEYQTGYLNAKKTPHLKNVQCESCHGPGSLHVAEELENAKKAGGHTHQHAADLSPWKADGMGVMPPLEKLEAMVKEKDRSKWQGMLTDAENKVYLRVYEMCQKCHDTDNDPKFELAAYWHHVAHTGLGKKK